MMKRRLKDVLFFCSVPSTEGGVARESDGDDEGMPTLLGTNLQVSWTLRYVADARAWEKQFGFDSGYSCSFQMVLVARSIPLLPFCPRAQKAKTKVHNEAPTQGRLLEILNLIPRSNQRSNLRPFSELKSRSKRPAWLDPDDLDAQVSLTSIRRLRKHRDTAAKIMIPNGDSVDTKSSTQLPSGPPHVDWRCSGG